MSWFVRGIRTVVVKPQQIALKAIENMSKNFVNLEIDDPVNLKNAPVFVGIDKLDPMVEP